MKLKVNDVLMMNPEYSEKHTFFGKCEIVLVIEVESYHYKLEGTYADSDIAVVQNISKSMAPTHFTYLGAL